MGNYTKSTDFAIKDTLNTGNSAKVIRGAEFETEFDAIAQAISEKPDANNSVLTGTTSVVSLSLGGVVVNATAAEINALDNVGTNIGVGVGLGPVVTTDGSQTLSNKVIAGAGISGGSINNTPIGAITASTGAFSTLDAQSLSVGDSDQLTITTQGRLTSSTYISASEFRLGDWTINLSTNDIVFNYLGTPKFKLATTGELTASNDLTAFGTL